MKYEDYVELNRDIVDTGKRVLKVAKEVFGNPEKDWDDIKETIKISSRKISKDDFEEFKDNKLFKSGVEKKKKELEDLKKQEKEYNKQKVSQVKEEILHYSKNI